MHFSNFENLNLQEETQIFYTNLAGNGIHGIYKGNYSRSQGAFDFHNFNGGKIERIYLKDIQVLQENN